jgi:tetratricopeptide (TPR) repeat protein
MSSFVKGNELYNNKNYGEALSYYIKAIDEKDNEPYSYYNASVCYIKLKDFSKAIDMLSKAIDLNLDAKYFFNLAYCYSMINSPQKALRYFNMAWALDNSDKDCEKAINLIVNKYKKAP